MSQGEEHNRPPLVLLHGLSFDRTMWRPALKELERLEPGRRVLAIDLPGHGESCDAPERDPEDVLRAIHAAVTEAGMEGPVVVGHSLGAMLATFYAAKFSCRGVINVDQPMQVEPFLRFVHGFADQLRGPAFPAVWASFQSGMHAELLPPEAQELVRNTGKVDQDLIVGYWSSVLDNAPSMIVDQLAGVMLAVRAAANP